MEITDTVFANDVYSFLWSLAHEMMCTKNSFYVGNYKLFSKEKAPFRAWLRVTKKRKKKKRKLLVK